MASHISSINCLRNQRALITRQLTELIPAKGTFRQLELEQLHVQDMGASSHNRWSTFKREKGSVLMVSKDFCSSWV